MHHLVTRWFIIEYNLQIQRTFTYSNYQNILHIITLTDYQVNTDTLSTSENKQ
jgi:hypothetical protein